MTAKEELIVQLLGETVIDATEAARRCGVTTAALIRWIRVGKPLGAGLLTLDGYQSGRTWMTSVEALARFLASSPRLAQHTSSKRGPTQREIDARRQRGRAKFSEAKRRLLAK